MKIELKTVSLQVPVLRWRYPRFSVLSLLVAVTIFSIALGWWMDHRKLTREIDRLRNRRPDWSIGQVLGPPNTPSAGDRPTAWASKTPDSQEEWLVLGYGEKVLPKGVHVHENYNPGAVVKVSVFDDQGKEIVAWEGVDPTPTTDKSGVSKIDLDIPFTTNRIKLYLDSPAVKGWNEIDAVGLVHGDDQILWAQRAEASSSYGDNNGWPSPYTFGGVEYLR